MYARELSDGIFWGTYIYVCHREVEHCIFFIISDQLGMIFMQANWILVVSYLSKAEISCIFFKNSGTMEWSEKKDIPLCLKSCRPSHTGQKRRLWAGHRHGRKLPTFSTKEQSLKLTRGL